MEDAIRRLRKVFAATLAAVLILPGFPSRGLAAFELNAEAGSAASSARAVSSVATIPDFHNWLVGVNATLGLPPRDLAAISFQAAPAVSAATAGAAVRFEPGAGRIQVSPQGQDQMPPSAPAETVTINLRELPQLRVNVERGGFHAQDWLKRVGSVSAEQPAALVEALNHYFDRSAAQSSSAFDPVVRTADVLAGSLPAHMRSAFDAEAGSRQRAALKAWQDAPHRTYVLVNSYSFKDDGTPGLNYYDMRPLAQILWAADPKVDVIFVTALPVDESMVRHVLQGHPHADEIRRRVHFVSLNDPGPDFLSQKLLDPKHKGTIGELRGLIGRIGAPAVLYPYMGGPYEWRIAQELNIPDAVNAAHPSMIYWGTKSGGHKIFNAALSRYQGSRKVRVKLATGYGDLYDIPSMAKKLKELLNQQPDLDRVVVKLNLGSSGEGNSFLNVAGWGVNSEDKIRGKLERVLRSKKIGVPDASGHIDSFADVMASEGAALEAFIPGISKATFPSVQCEIAPDGTARVLSSHEQILVDGNTYVGATLGADNPYRAVIERAALEAAQELAKKGIVGRFGTDFAAIPQEDGGYDVYYIENNIRLTGTTHPLVAAIGLTGGVYRDGALRDPRTGRRILYKSLDHDVRPNLIGIGVDAFLARFDRADARSLLFNANTGTGVVFHLVPAVKAAGNVGYTIIARSKRGIASIHRRLTAILNDLELEHLADRHVFPQHRFIAKDARVQVDAAIGHALQVTRFRAFLDRHQDYLYRGEKASGIVFHPHGYTVLGRDEAELAAMERVAKRLLVDFLRESRNP